MKQQTIPCGECRARRRKCDRKRPICSGCLQKTLPCQYESDDHHAAQQGSPPPAVSDFGAEHLPSTRSSSLFRSEEEETDEAFRTYINDLNATSTNSSPRAANSETIDVDADTARISESQHLGDCGDAGESRTRPEPRSPHVVGSATTSSPCKRTQSHTVVTEEAALENLEMHHDADTSQPAALEGRLPCQRSVPVNESLTPGTKKRKRETTEPEGGNDDPDTREYLSTTTKFMSELRYLRRQTKKLAELKEKNKELQESFKKVSEECKKLKGKNKKLNTDYKTSEEKIQKLNDDHKKSEAITKGVNEDYKKSLEDIKKLKEKMNLWANLVQTSM